jgi:transcriptional regulator with XRE-family HTH domain
MTTETMGQRLQRLRQAAGMSQPALAQAAKVPLGTLRNWEQGRRIPALDAAARLAQAMGVSLDELAGIVGQAARSKANGEQTKGKAGKAGKRKGR